MQRLNPLVLGKSIIATILRARCSQWWWASGRVRRRRSPLSGSSGEAACGM